MFGRVRQVAAPVGCARTGGEVCYPRLPRFTFVCRQQDSAPFANLASSTASFETGLLIQPVQTLRLVPLLLIMQHFSTSAYYAVCDAGLCIHVLSVFLSVLYHSRKWLNASSTFSPAGTSSPPPRHPSLHKPNIAAKLRMCHPSCGEVAH